MRAFRWSLTAGVALLACSSVTGPAEPKGPIQLPASLTVTRAWINVQEPNQPLRLEVRNTGAAAATARFGICAFLVQGHRLQAGYRPPEWTYLLPEINGCLPDLLYLIDVPPNSSVPYVLGSIPPHLTAKGPVLSLVFQVEGEAEPRTVVVDQLVVD